MFAQSMQQKLSGLHYYSEHIESKKQYDNLSDILWKLMTN